ncbi:hypothetical protein [Nocardia fluminea]
MHSALTASRSTCPGSAAEDGLRLLAGLGASSGNAHPTMTTQVRE